MTKLGDIIAASSSAPAKTDRPRRLLAALASSRVLEPITVPGLGATALMTLVGSERQLEIEGEVSAIMASRGLGDPIAFAPAWELARAIRTLADAVLDDDQALRASPPAFGSVEEWGRVPREQVQEAWRMYGELCEKHDPASQQSFTEEEMELIRIAVVKKNATALPFFGAKRLSAFLLSMADQLASSTTAESSPGPLSSES